jgi:hypothetical protein
MDANQLPGTLACGDASAFRRAIRRWTHMRRVASPVRRPPMHGKRAALAVRWAAASSQACTMPKIM